MAKQLDRHSQLLAGIQNTHTIGSQIIKQIILPEIEKEVNEGKNFATLRQIFYAQVLAVWFKRNLKQALLNQVYANKSTVKGIERPFSTETLPRKYFSGGFVEGPIRRADEIAGRLRTKIELTSREEGSLKQFLFDGYKDAHASQELSDAYDLAESEMRKYARPEYEREPYDYDLAMSHSAQKRTNNTAFPGGIDLSQQDSALQVTKDANGGVKVFVDPALIARIEREGLPEVDPVIINMQPADIKSLFGVEASIAFLP